MFWLIFRPPPSMVCLEPSFHISWWMPRDSFFSHLLHTMATDAPRVVATRSSLWFPGKNGEISRSFARNHFARREATHHGDDR